MMKLLTYFYTCACLSLVSLNANQIQLAFSGESTEEVIQILKESPALALRKSVDGKGSEVSLGEFIWHVKMTRVLSTFQFEVLSRVKIA